MLFSLHVLPSNWQIRLVIWHAAESFATLLDFMSSVNCLQSCQPFKSSCYAAHKCCIGSSKHLLPCCTAQHTCDGICPLMVWRGLQVSIVSQEPILFAESIMHNIAYGMPGGSASVSLAMVKPWPAIVLHLLTHCHVRC